MSFFKRVWLYIDPVSDKIRRQAKCISLYLCPCHKNMISQQIEDILINVLAYWGRNCLIRVVLSAESKVKKVEKNVPVQKGNIIQTVESTIRYVNFISFTFWRL